jgi:site-specific DNA recombinase
MPPAPTRLPSLPADQIPAVTRRLQRAARRKGPRGRDAVDADRQQLLDETERLIDGIAAEFGEGSRGDRPAEVGAIYARYSTNFQQSVGDQVRALLEAASQRGIYVPREHIYFDLAVSGAKERRPGLQALQRTLARISHETKKPERASRGK